MALLGRETQALLQKNGSWQQQLIVEINRVVAKPQAGQVCGAIMKTVLIAEDNPVNRELLRELLEIRGYSVAEAC